MSNTVTKTDTYTLTYDSGVQGFPSFYSYFADWMIGMNNFFYTFKGGDLFRHNTNPSRNQYYGINYNSVVQSVFNDQPLENKLFKTINLEGDDSWGVVIESDQQDSGFIEASYFEEKEGSYFAFIRNSGGVPAQLDEYALRSLNGLGSSSNVTVVGNLTTIDYPNTLYIGNIISVGDMIYHGNPNPQLAGQVTQINQNLPAGINQVVINTDGNTFVPAVAPVPTTFPFPTTTEYTLYIKNAVSESHGILGHYGVFTVTNNNTAKVELFAVESEAMKSFP
tara:strand:- start:1764 stop:2600 length:837 start_codon:yes stop_codon:yes gene_type:complete